MGYQGSGERKFNGKKYHYVSEHKDKGLAKSRAKSLKKKGRAVRVIKTDSYYPRYVVFDRKK